jgi:hypothetical protein
VRDFGEGIADEHRQRVFDRLNATVSLEAADGGGVAAVVTFEGIST